MVTSPDRETSPRLSYKEWYEEEGEGDAKERDGRTIFVDTPANALPKPKPMTGSSDGFLLSKPSCNVPTTLAKYGRGRN